MMDTETGSWWSHVVGVALDGQLKGKKLKTLPVVQTNWADWYAKHPDTKVLKKSEQILSSSYEAYFQNPDRMGLFRTRYLMERMPGKTLIHGISYSIHALAIADETIKVGNIIYWKLGKTNILVIKSSDGGVRVFINDSYLFTKTEGKNLFTDDKTNSVWNLETGDCLQGKLEGTKLTPIPVTIAYWFAWSTFYPNTSVLD